MKTNRILKTIEISSFENNKAPDSNFLETLVSETIKYLDHKSDRSHTPSSICYNEAKRCFIFSNYEIPQNYSFFKNVLKAKDQFSKITIKEEEKDFCYFLFGVKGNEMIVNWYQDNIELLVEDAKPATPNDEKEKIAKKSG